MNCVFFNSSLLKIILARKILFKPREQREIYDIWRSVNDRCNDDKKRVPSQPKANLSSPTLVNLDRIANVVAPCPSVTSGEIDSTILSASVSPEIKSMAHDKTVDASASTTTASSTPRCRASMSLVNDDEKLTANCSGKPKSMRDRRPTTTVTRNKTNDPQDINADDDEEIDVERVDERDPMWRPW